MHELRERIDGRDISGMATDNVSDTRYTDMTERREKAAVWLCISKRVSSPPCVRI